MASDRSPEVFKGIALFTPGGDLIYCIDPQKQVRWHIHLCNRLQNLLGLSEPPHFLVPCYGATVDRFIDPLTRNLQQIAEVSPLVVRYQPLLNAVFGIPDLTWKLKPLQPEICDPIVLNTYRDRFPQLWEFHDLVVQYERTASFTATVPLLKMEPVPKKASPNPQGYVLRLFVSGSSMATERTLHKIHALLERSLDQPYTLKIIDVTQHPEQAEIDHVTATPTLVRAWPQPTRRIVGSLDHADQLLGMLHRSQEE
jgi:circadian clock protein KaiB